MALEKQSVAINFAQGIDTKTDPFQIPIGNFLAMENSVFNTFKRLQKRNGYDALGTSISSLFSFSYQAFGANITAGAFVSTFKNEIVCGDGLNFYSYSEANDKLVYKGRAAINTLSTLPIFQNQYHQILADSAINTSTGYALYAWESWSRVPALDGTYQGMTFALFDNSSGQQLFNATTSTDGSRPKCVAIGTKTYVVFFDSATSELRYFEVSATGVGATANLVTNINATNPNYDLMVVGSTLYVAYNGTGTTVKIASFNSSMSAIATASEAESGSSCVGIFSDGSNVWVAYNNGSATKAFIYNSALAVQVLGPTTIDSGATALNVKNITGAYDGTRGIIFYDQPGAPAVGQGSGISTDAAYTQPAVGSTVTISLASSTLAYLGQVVFITGGGYYYVQSFNSATNDITAVNLGYVGNAAPAASVTNPAELFPVSGNINAIINFNTLLVGGTVGTVATFMRSAALNSKAFVKDSIASVVISYDSPIQPTYFLCSLYNITSLSAVQFGNLSAKVFDGEAGGIPYKSILPSVNLDSDGNYNVALPKRIYSVQKTTANAPVTVYYNGIFDVSFDLYPTQVSTEELGNVLLIGSGSTLMYDGQQVVEQGFHVDPENVTGVNSGAGGSLSSGSYGYQVVYQWIDANGFIYKSAPSPALTITASANVLTTLTIPTLRLTQKGDATITVYRTAANGSIYYRLDTQRIAAGFYPVNNSLAANVVNYVDGVADSQIIGNEQLYTTGEVEDIGPPGATSITNFKSRAILIPNDNRNAFWFSKQIIPGEPIEFSDSFIKNIDTVGGELIGALPMDDKLVLYKPTSIYYMNGNGPAASGANDDFIEPLLITTDCGAIDKASIVAMPFGHMFKSQKGIYLIDRSLQAKYIGNEVEAYNDVNVLSAVLRDKDNQVLFLLESGITLMYDYNYDQWATFTNTPGISSCISQNKHTYITSGGVIYRETPAVYVDGTDPVLLSFTTGWINVAGLQGFERAYFFFFLAKYISAHSLTVTVYYDYEETEVQSLTITPDSTESIEQWRIFFDRQKCQAFKIKVQENYTGTTGAGLTMSGLNLQVGLKDNKPKLRAAQSTA